MTEISREYAVSLFSIAREKGEEAEYMSALYDAQKILNENPKYSELLNSPNIAKSERIKALDAAFAEILPENVLIFLKILCEKRRMSIFDTCVADYKRLFDEFSNTVQATVISAVELSDTQKAKLKQKLEGISGKNVELRCSVDVSLYGGLTVEMGGCVYDGSLKSKLRDIKGGLLDER